MNGPSSSHPRARFQRLWSRRTKCGGLNPQCEVWGRASECRWCSAAWKWPRVSPALGRHFGLDPPARCALHRRPIRSAVHHSLD